MKHDRIISIIDKHFPDRERAILVSACLLGINCTYDNSNKKNDFVLQLAKIRKLIPVCPEQLGGLSTPRTSQSIVEGDGKDVLDGNAQVMNEKNIDVTDEFLKGASEIGKLVHLYEIKTAILKEKSPSCGVKFVYNRNDLVKGSGVTTAYLLSKNITIFSEKDIEKLFTDNL